MQRPWGIAALWVVATTAAVVLAWGGVQLVADRVTDQSPVGPLASLSSPSTGTATPEGTPSAAATTTGSPTPAPGAVPTTPPVSGTTGPAGATTPATTPPTTTPPTAPAPPTTPSTTPTSTPTGGSSPAPAASPVTRSYTLVGGTAIIRFSAQVVEVVSATPNPGFTLEPVERDGPLEVRVEFESSSHRSRLKASWEGGPREEIDEDPRD